jgi:flagellar FliJ protein
MAKPFKLQTVLNHRQRLEDIAVQQLAEALNREKNLLLQLNERRAAVTALVDEFAKRQQTGISVHELQVYRLSIQRNQTQLKSLEGQAAQLSREVETQRRQLAEACRKKKLLEKLKEKHQEEQILGDNLKEAAQLDEIALRMGITEL